MRFPDTASRLHALTKADNLGLCFLVAGLMLQAANAQEVLALLLVWLLVLTSTGYVGLATVAAGACLPLLAWWSDAEAPRMWFAIGIALYLAFTHRSNLRRLWNGNESRFERARLLHRLYRGSGR